MEDFKKRLFSKNFAAIHEIKPILTLDKPIYVGFSILDLSKLLMHELHYNYMRVKYGSGTKLLFTDTNSLVHETETDEVYVDFYKDKVSHEFSDNPKDFRFYDPANKNVIGKMKDEVREILLISLLG